MGPSKDHGFPSIGQVVFDNFFILEAALGLEFRVLLKDPWLVLGGSYLDF